MKQFPLPLTKISSIFHFSMYSPDLQPECQNLVYSYSYDHSNIVLFTNFQISTRTTKYQSSRNGAYSSKHVRLCEIFHKVKYLLIEESTLQRSVSLLMNIKTCYKRNGLEGWLFR